LDSLEDMPAFDKPENIPLIVPDIPEHLCTGKNKQGKPCGFPHRHGSKFCTVHDPAITQAQRDEWRTRKRGKTFATDPSRVKTKAELLEILSGRIDGFLARFGQTGGIDVEQTICEMMRTYVVVLKAEADSDAKVFGWRLGRKGTA
jgi:hypothetical protein